MVNIPTNYKMGTGLAATIMGQQAGLEQEKMGLENLSAIMKQPGEELQANKDMALLNDPNFVKANTQFQLAATQAKLGDAEKQKAVNGLDILLSQLQMAEGDPQKQRQIVYQSFIEKGVDPTSPMAQAILADPYNRTKQARDDLVGTYGYTPEVAGKERLENVQGQWGMKKQESANAAHLAGQRITAGATAQYRDQAQLAGMLKDATNNVNNIQNNLAKIESAEGKNALINQFMAQGVSQAEAEAAVNSPEFKQQLQEQLRLARAEQEHLKKQSPYFKGFNFGSPAPASTGSSSGLPPGVKLVNQ